MQQVLGVFQALDKVAETESEPVDEEIFKDIALIQQQNISKIPANSRPYAIVVLGGGFNFR